MTAGAEGPGGGAAPGVSGASSEVGGRGGGAPGRPGLGPTPQTDRGSDEPRLESVAVVGAGLIGTSIALALRAHGVRVTLHDSDPVTAVRAAELGAGEAAPWPGAPVAVADLCVVATPPLLTASVLRQAQELGLAVTYTDVASVRARTHADAEREGVDRSCFVGGHPMAGRERSGPAAARPDLFIGRPWILTPGDALPEHRARVHRLVLLCGAVPVQMDPAEHDEAVALVSHVPQILSSLAAGRLGSAPEEAVALSGSGVTDVTRIAGSPPEMWLGILEANAAPVASVLARVRDDLDRAIDALQELAGGGSTSETSRAALLELLRAGVLGRSRIPGKHGSAPTTYAVVPVVVADRPRQLAQLMLDAGESGVNVEDVAIEHAPGRPIGVVELSVRPESVVTLADALRERGWTVHV